MRPNDIITLIAALTVNYSEVSYNQLICTIDKPGDLTIYSKTVIVEGDNCPLDANGNSTYEITVVENMLKRRLKYTRGDNSKNESFAREYIQELNK